MSSTLFDLCQGCVAILVFGLMFVGPGYLWARLFRVAGFGERSRSEQILWSVTLSLPLAIALCALLGRLLPPVGIAVVFISLDAAAAGLWWRGEGWRRRAAQAREPVRRESRWMFCLMMLFGLYCLLWTVDVQAGHRVYVSTVIADWSVRVQMVKAAMRSGVPPINGLSTLSAGPDGHAPHLRYYYFWYVVVAQMARAFRLNAQAALAASCAWAGWALISAFFLLLKYMTAARERIQARCFLGLLTGAVLGLDILPTALLWLAPKLHPYPEMEWWHQDRTPSFLGSVLYAPHHMAAFACLLMGFLVLFLAARGEDGGKPSAKAIASSIAFSGIAFAAASGTSTFPTFCFVFVLTFWAIDLLRRREWTAVGALASSGVLALLLAHGYLHELGAGNSAASGFASFKWRNDDFVLMQQVRHHLLLSHGKFVAWIAREPAVIVMDLFDLGFYAAVIVAMVRKELLRRGRLTAQQCALWALVLGAAVPFLFLSSTATSGPNDLGVDAGFLLRLGLQVWSVGWISDWWQAGGFRSPAKKRSYAAGFVAVLFLLGLSAQVYQVLSIRLYYPMVGSGLVHKQMDAFTQDRLANRIYNIREAWLQFDGKVPVSAPDTESVQFNPVGAMQPVETMYSSHQIASWDTGCGTSYGGDYKSCAPVYQALLFLFGNTQAGVDAGRAENDRQDGAATRVATAEDFTSVCRTLHLRAIMAESTDSIWGRQNSWVWTTPVLAANTTARVLACPVTP